MGMLAAALAWAARGFRVFPLQAQSKDPIDICWTVLATTEPEVIKNFWTDPVTGFERDYNVGFLTTGHIVLDVDVKKGKDGLATFMRLGLEFDTLTCRTPSGGYHLIYRGEAGQSPIEGPNSGIDVRSRNGYIVAPGSILQNGRYEIEIDQPVIDFPEDLKYLLRPPRTRAEPAVPSIDLDTPESVEIAAYFLQRQAIHAAEGSRGYTCYVTSCRLRDLGVSQQTAQDLLLEHWNEFNSPPMPLDDLIQACGNAYRYATGTPGSAAPAAEFGDVKHVAMPRPPSVAEYVNGALYTFGAMLEASTIAARPWIFGDVLMAGVVTSLIAAGGSGKSVLILTIAAHLAVGKDFLGWRVFKPGASIIYNAEDDLEEQSRRLNVICDAYGLDKNVVRSSIMFLDGDTLGFRVTEGAPPKVNDRAVQELIEAARKAKVVLIALDPIAEIHTANENDNMQMNYVMSVLRLIARQTRAAVLTAQHTGKPPAASSASWAGNQNAGRGASSVPAAARIVLTLFPAAEADCAGIGVQPSEKHLYVRLDGAKANFSPSRGKPHWLRWHTRELENTDQIGVLLEHDAGTAQDKMHEQIVGCCYSQAVKLGAGSLTIDQAIIALREEGLLLDREDHIAARKRVSALFSQQIRGGGLTLIYNQSAKMITFS